MEAIVWHAPGDVRLDDVPDPTMRHPHDALVRITTSAICGTDLHFVRGTVNGMPEGTVLAARTACRPSSSGPLRPRRAGRGS